jgi:hypothetical protein
MSYAKDVSVIVEDNCITVIGDDGEKDTIVFLKSGSENLKIVDKRNYSPTTQTINFQEETYIERLYAYALKEIEQMEKRVVAESFRNDRMLVNIKNTSFLDHIKETFRGKSKINKEIDDLK